MKELVFEVGLWRVMNVWRSDKSINKGSQQKLTRNRKEFSGLIIDNRNWEGGKW